MVAVTSPEFSRAIMPNNIRKIMSKNKNVKVDKALRQSVLDTIDHLYKHFLFLDRTEDKIALQIIESISYDYAMMNCELHFIIEEQVIPYLKKLNENQKLEIVKGILTDGYVDINGNRFYFLHQPYVNFDKDDNAKRTRYTEKVPDAK